MFKVKWNVQNNGIILSDNITDDEAIPAPRPVYLQELQMLEVNKKYRMPKTDLPICWNIDRKSTRLNSSHTQKSRMPSSA